MHLKEYFEKGGNIYVSEPQEHTPFSSNAILFAILLFLLPVIAVIEIFTNPVSNVDPSIYFLVPLIFVLPIYLFMRRWKKEQSSGTAGIMTLTAFSKNSIEVPINSIISLLSERFDMQEGKEAESNIITYREVLDGSLSFYGSIDLLQSCINHLRSELTTIKGVSEQFNKGYLFNYVDN